MRSTGKCDIMFVLIMGDVFIMKTKIIYISGNEIFDMRDIRAAFDEVRCALNLDQDTLLFGVPVDMDDAGIMNKSTTQTPEITEPVKEIITPAIEESVVIEEIVDEPVAEPTTKKRGRPRKEIESVEINDVIEEKTESVDDETNDDDVVETKETEEPNIPILSVLSVNEEIENSDTNSDAVEQIDIIDEISDEKIEEQNIEETTEDVAEKTEEESEPDLEKLLSEMTPLAEDTRDETSSEPAIEDSETNDISVDATLEQLATEFAQNQDKIASESKSSSRSKIGKLRNILPFKQSKHKDQGIGDLLEWAGIAANDEDFSVPGFFTNVASKK